MYVDLVTDFVDGNGRFCYYIEKECGGYLISVLQSKAKLLKSTLEMAIIVGIPYPAPGVRQKALQHYYDISFNGQGWKFAVESPAVRKLLQAAGRVVRSETDRGFIVIADSRTGRFLEYIPELEQSDDIVSEIGEFFEA